MNAAVRPRFDAIDGLRAIAVLAVVLHHAGLLYGATGNRGVDLFFVISGFCLALPFLRTAPAMPVTLDRHRFWLGRALRIVPPYWAALALFFALSFTPFGTPAVDLPADRGEVVQNLFFILSYTPTYNPSFWTLGVEARWYLVFPLILALYGRSKIAFAALGLGSYVSYAFAVPMIDLGVLPAFMLGIVAADLQTRNLTRSPWWIAVALGSLVVAIAIRPSDHYGGPLWHFASFALVVAGVGALQRPLSFRPLVFTGIASYSIYLLHQPLLVFAVAHGIAPWLAALGTIVIGFAFYSAVERPSMQLRGGILGRALAKPGDR